MIQSKQLEAHMPAYSFWYGFESSGQEHNWHPALTKLLEWKAGVHIIALIFKYLADFSLRMSWN